MLPIVEELPDWLDAVTAFTKLRDEVGVVFLDSALRHPTLGRYSYVSAWPQRLSPLAPNLPEKAPLASLQQQLLQAERRRVPDLPPFQGGAIVLLAYDFARAIERLPPPQKDEFQVPTCVWGWYDFVLAFDHSERRGWIISQGTALDDSSVAYARGRLRQVKRFLFDGVREEMANAKAELPTRLDCASPIQPGQLAPQYETSVLPRLTSNFSREQYLAAVTRAIEYIRAGDIFQVNLAQRLLYPTSEHSADLYLRLRQRNPATFSAYMDIGDFQVVSASPERFLCVRDGIVEARPIKGTRGRSSRPEADLFAADDLQASEKDRAENVMIVDLMRNDLARVCEDESVHVTKLCGLESYQFVQHLVSVIEGRLRAGVTPTDVLTATFPGGSITGAPKIRAMEIIAELEPTARGPYCGSLGYIGLDGTMDFNILIRTITSGRGWLQLPVGGGIVAQSDPEQEYEETWQKALGMIRALR